MSKSLVVYFPGQTFFHKLDPRTKIIFMVLVSTVIFAVQDLYLSAFILAVMVILWMVARLPVAIVYGFLKALLPVFAFLFIVQALLYPGVTPIIKPLIPSFIPWIGGMGQINLEGILFAVLLMFRLLAMVILLPLVSMTTPVHILALGMVRMGLPYRLAYTITAALNMVPILQSEIGVIVDAQKLRAMSTFEKGSIWSKVKSYPVLVTPLVIGAMRRAQSMAVAMDSRAFGAMKTRTYIEDINLRPVDWIFMIASTIGTVGILILATKI
ncbi:MAG: energy-coupling factor transporter transmembrane protein EcfT [Anaerolineales bacterium]|nr:energy-coupling factor transporter transmembrane protein EcfT [Anaerolineales bacterium]